MFCLTKIPMLTFDSDESLPVDVFSFDINRRKISAIDTYFVPNEVYDYLPFDSWEFQLRDGQPTFSVCGHFVDNWVYYKTNGFVTKLS